MKRLVIMSPAFPDGNSGFLRALPSNTRASVSGMSLVELVIVLLIFGGLATAIFMSSLLSNKAYTSSEAYVHVQGEARRALNEMTRELRGAGPTPTTGPPPPTLIVAANQVDFQLPLGYNLAAPCPANAVCWGARDQNGNHANWSIRYRRAVNGTIQQLVREIVNVPPGQAGQVQGTRVLANDVSQLTFAQTGNTLTIQLQVQQNSQQLGGGSISAAPAATPLTTKVRLRNI